MRAAIELRKDAMERVTLQWCYTGAGVRWNLGPELGGTVPLPDGVTHIESRCALLDGLRPIWPHLALADTIDVQVALEHALPPPLELGLREAWKVITVTHRVLRQCRDQRNVAAAHDGVLVFSPDDSVVLREFLAPLQHRTDVRVVCLNFPTGWNKVARQWEELPESVTLPHLLPIFFRERIRTVVTHNTYYLGLNLQRSLLVLPIIQWLGMEWINCHFDLTEGVMQLERVLFREPASRCFAVEPQHEQDWVEQLPAIRAEPIPLRLACSVPAVTEVAAGSPLVMASNSRLESVLQNFCAVLHVIEQADPRHLYRDVTLWYFGLRRLMIRALRNDSLLMSDRLLGKLYHLYLDLYTFMKCDVLDGIMGRYPLELYGDPGWQPLFPECYQQRYLSEVEYQEKFSNGRAIGLLANQNLCYVINNPVFARAVMLGAPFFCYESLVCTDGFAPFRTLEYGDAEQLLTRVERVNAISQNVGMTACRERYAAMFREYRAAFAVAVIRPGEVRAVHGTRFAQECGAHMTQWNQVLDTYIAQHQSRLLQDYHVLFQRPPGAIDWQRSRYAERRFFRRLHAQWAAMPPRTP